MATVEPSQPHETLDQPTNPHVALIGQVLCVLVPLTIWFAPLNVDPTIKHVLAIVGFMVIAWITQALDYALAGLIGCFLFWALGIVRFPIAFSGSPTTPLGFSLAHF